MRLPSRWTDPQGPNAKQPQDPAGFSKSSSCGRTGHRASPETAAGSASCASISLRSPPLADQLRFFWGTPCWNLIFYGHCAADHFPLPHLSEGFGDPDEPRERWTLWLEMTRSTVWWVRPSRGLSHSSIRSRRRLRVVKCGMQNNDDSFQLLITN